MKQTSVAILQAETALVQVIFGECVGPMSSCFLRADDVDDLRYDVWRLANRFCVL
jgi:hypothetical protein